MIDDLIRLIKLGIINIENVTDLTVKVDIQAKLMGEME